MTSNTTTGCSRTAAISAQQNVVVARHLLVKRAVQAIPCPGNPAEDCGSANAMAVYGKAGATGSTSSMSAPAMATGTSANNATMSMGAGGGMSMGGGQSVCVRKTAVLLYGTTISVMTGAPYTTTT